MDKKALFTREEYLRRIERVEAAMDRVGLDGLIAYSVGNQPGPVAYLAGYEPGLGLHDVAFFTVAPGGQAPYALVTNAFWDDPRERTWVDDVRVTADFGPALADHLPGSACRIGIAGFRYFPTPVHTALATAFPRARFEDATALLLDVARVKSDGEVEAIRSCAAMTDAGGRAFLAGVREGASERGIQAEVERAIRLAGADGLSFSTQVYSGSQVAAGIGFAADRVLARGEQVQLDCGARHQGYRGDLSRVTTVGRPSRAVEEMMDATAGMYDAMHRSLRPGVAVAHVARSGIAVAEDRGMAADLYRSPNHPGGYLGHGIGCWYHEFPEVHPEAEGIVEANMVIVLEPILVRTGVGGAKIEDAVVVTESGADRLSTLDIRPWLSGGEEL